MPHDTIPAKAAAATQPRAGHSLKRELTRSNRRKRRGAFLLVFPLLVVVSVFFAMPILGLLTGAIHSPAYVKNFPQSAVILKDEAKFNEPFYEALFADVRIADEARTTGRVGRRLNQDVPGFSTLLRKTTRSSRKEVPQSGTYKDWFAAVDDRWVDPRFQAAIRRAAAPVTDFFVLKSLDLSRTDTGELTRVDPDQALFVNVFIRTFGISLGVTLICCVLGYPLAWSLVQASPKWRNIMLLGVLFPFWTSLLVRTAAWVIVLQKEGPINSTLQSIGLIDSPLTLVFNRFGVFVALTHILLPFLVLPLYSVMKSIPRDYMRAAKSLGARPVYAFMTAYFPLTLPGLSAGAILVFIMSIGYYITPALVGGPKDQMISYFIAFYTNNTINWGLASALALNLLIVTLVLYALYQKLTGSARVSMGV
ncbi:MAG: ABC transporter permease [Paracoccaceae bacterium]